MLSVASSLYIALPRDHRSSTWQPGRTTEEDYLGSKAISDNLLKAKSLLALVLNPLTTSMWRLLVMRSFPGGPGFTRIFTFQEKAFVRELDRVWNLPLALLHSDAVSSFAPPKRERFLFLLVDRVQTSSSPLISARRNGFSCSMGIEGSRT